MRRPSTQPPRAGPGRGPTTVLYPVYSPEMGGSQISLLTLVERLDPARYRPLVLLPGRGDGRLVRSLDDRGVPWRITGALHAPASLLRFTGIARRSGAAICHLHTVRTYGVVARLLGLAVVETVNMLRGATRHASAIPWIDRIMSAASDRIIAVSDGVREQLLGRGIPARRLVILRDGVDLARFHPPERPVEREPRVLVTGRLVPLKRPLDAVEIFQRARERAGAAHPVRRATLVFAGDGPLAPAVRARASALGLGPSVELLGYRDDPADLYREAAVLLHPSASEALGRVVVEAAASGVSAIVSDTPGGRETVVPGVTGWLYPVGAVEEAATALLDALSGEGAVRGRAALAFARERFDADAWAASMMRLYDAVRSER